MPRASACDRARGSKLDSWRVMENMSIYKARLNNGSAPLTLSNDLRRGASVAAGPRPYE